MGTHIGLFKYANPTGFACPAYENFTSLDWDNIQFSSAYLDTYAVRDIYVNDEGTYLFAVGTSTSLFLDRWQLSTPYDISTATNQQTRDILSELGTASVQKIFLSKDGSYIYIFESFADKFHAYQLTTPYDLSTASLHHTELKTNTAASSPKDDPVNIMSVNSSGTGGVFHMGVASSRRVGNFSLSTPYDLRTWSDTHNAAGTSLNPREAMCANGYSISDVITATATNEIYKHTANDDLSAFTTTSFSLSTSISTIFGEGFAREQTAAGNRVYMWGQDSNTAPLNRRIESFTFS